jgi:hypothetical protein
MNAGRRQTGKVGPRAGSDSEQSVSKWAPAPVLMFD